MNSTPGKSSGQERSSADGQSDDETQQSVSAASSESSHHAAVGAEATVGLQSSDDTGFVNEPPVVEQSAPQAQNVRGPEADQSAGAGGAVGPGSGAAPGYAAGSGGDAAPQVAGLGFETLRDVSALVLLVLSFGAKWGDRTPLLTIAIVAAIVGASSRWWANLLGLRPHENALARICLMTPVLLMVVWSAIAVALWPASELRKAWGPGCLVVALAVAISWGNIRALPFARLRRVALVICAVSGAFYVSGMYRGEIYEAIQLASEIQQNLGRAGVGFMIQVSYFSAVVTGLGLPLLVALAWWRQSVMLAGSALTLLVVSAVCGLGLPGVGDYPIAMPTFYFSGTGAPLAACVLLLGGLLVSSDWLSNQVVQSGRHAVFYRFVAGVAFGGALACGPYMVAAAIAGFEVAIQSSGDYVRPGIPLSALWFCFVILLMGVALIGCMWACLKAAKVGSGVSILFWVGTGVAALAAVVLFVSVFSMNTKTPEYPDSQTVAALTEYVLADLRARAVQRLRVFVNVPGTVLVAVLPAATMLLFRSAVLRADSAR